MRIQPCNGLARRESFGKRQICPDLKKYMIHGEREAYALYPIPFSFSRARTT